MVQIQKNVNHILYYRVARWGSVETLQILLDSGIKPSSSFIANAACTGNVNMVKFVLQNELNGVDDVDKDGCTAMMKATRNNKLTTVK